MALHAEKIGFALKAKDTAIGERMPPKHLSTFTTVAMGEFGVFFSSKARQL